MEFRLLGPLEAWRGKRRVDLGGAKQRAVLAMLLLGANEPVSTDSLIDGVWGEAPPASAANALQVYVSQLRKALGPDVIVTRAPGYVLQADSEQIDLARFERLVAEGRTSLAADEAGDARQRFADALELWRGGPLADLAFEPFAEPEVARLVELRLAVLEDRIEADLVLGKHAELPAELEALALEHPFRERLRAQLMLALYRTGRQAEALGVYRDARQTFDEELGIEPSPALQRLEQAILRQDPGLEPALPPREELGTTPPMRKPLTVLVVDLGEEADLDPEAWSHCEQQTAEKLAAVVERHGGSTGTLDSGRLVGVFGIPVVYEDDALRASRAALELLQLDSTLRAGVEAGEAIDRGDGLLASRVGGGLLRRAARLVDAAKPGQVLVGEHLARLAGRAISIEPRKRGPSRLVSVEADAPAIARRLDAPLVGRRRELDELREAFDRCVARRSAEMLTLVGPAGIGKSRLAGELIAELEGRAQVLVGRTLSYGEGITFWPLAEIVRGLAGDDARGGLERLLAGEPDGPLVAERLAAAIGASDRDRNNAEIFWGARRLFELLAERRPLLLVLDDLHWAEPTLLELVESVAAEAHGPVLVLCLARQDLLDARPAWPGARLLLEPLTEEETDELLEGLLGDARLDTGLRARIRDAAEGVPLFVEQMVAMLGEDAEDAVRIGVPPTIHALLAARLDLLATEERRVLERAAVAGREFASEGVAALAPDDPDDVAELLAALARKQLVDEHDSGGYRFRHQLIRDTAYEALPKLSRAELHERYADWLEAVSGERVVELQEILAYHLEQAWRYRAELDPDAESLPGLARRAAEHLDGAGRRAHARGDIPAAEGLLGRAAALPGDAGKPRAEVLLALAGVLREAGDFRWASEALDESLSIAADLGHHGLESKARVLELRIRLQTQSDLAFPELMRGADELIGQLEALGDEGGLAEAWAVVAWVPWIRCQAAATEEALRRALEYARRAGDEPAIAHSLNLLLGVWLFGETPVPRAMELCEGILTEAPQRRIEASAYRALAGLKAMLGQFEEARDLLDRDRAIIDELGLRVASAVAAEIWGMIELLAGDAAAAEERLRAGIAVLEPMGEKSGVSTLAAMLAEAVYSQGRLDEALELTHLSRDYAPSEDLSTQVQWRGACAKVLVRTGSAEAGEALAHEGVSLAADTDFLNLHGNALLGLAEVRRLADDPASARSAGEEALALFRRKGNTAAAKHARKLLAELKTRAATQA